MLSPFDPDIITLTEAAKRLPKLRTGRRVHPSTLWRWASRGLRGRKLETIRLGGRMCTSVNALNRFFAEAISRDDVEKPSPIGHVNDERRQVEIEHELNTRFQL